MNRMLRLVPGLALGACLAAGIAAVPATAAVPGQVTLKGTVTYFNGRYTMHVIKKNGNVDAVKLHQGTIINPTGLTLRPGMKVTILGVERHGVLHANEIDTPYRRYGYMQPVGVMPYFGFGYGGFGDFGLMGSPGWISPYYPWGPWDQF
ncbi:MAG: hypothetical protein ACYDGW_08725 [Vulcanimicrobiaceae bacterium]